MTQHQATIEFEDIPLAEARKMGRGPRMDPMLYHALKDKIQSLGNVAVRMTLPEGVSPTTMKNRLLRIAAELKMPLTVRKVPGGLLFWRSTEEDLTPVPEMARQAPRGQRKRDAGPGRRRG